MLLGAERAPRTVGIHRRAEDQPQDVARLVVDGLHRHLAAAQHLQIGLGQVVLVVAERALRGQAVGVGAHLDVEAVQRRLARVVGAAPVGDDAAVEAPLTAQNVVQQHAVVAAVLAQIAVVGAHDAPRAAVDHRPAEGRQVDLAQGPFADHDVDRSAPLLLVVQGEVLDAGRHAVLLQLLDVGHDHLARQAGVLTHVLEVAAVERRAVDVDTRAQQHILLAVAGLFADGPAVAGGHLRVPRGGQGRQCREGRDRVAGPAGIVPAVPFDLGADPVGTVAHHQFGDPQPRHAGRGEFRLGVAQGHLLLEGHSLQGILDALFDRGVVLQIERSGLLAPCARGERKEHQGWHESFLHGRCVLKVIRE